MRMILAALMMLQSAAPSGSISGTVVIAGSASQNPLALARVELSGGPILPLVARTDGSGRFAFANLPPGSYRLRVTKDGFIRQEYSKRAPIVIKSAEVHKPVVFALESAPTMAGRIQTENGEPIADILVRAMKAVYGPDGSRIFSELASTLSDDRGDYRLYWLDPGEYVFDIAGIPEDLYIKSERSAQTNLQGLTLRIGNGSPALFETLLGTDGGHILGTVADSTGKLFAGAQVVLVPKGDRRNLPSNYRVASSDEDGKFDMRGIPPGDYQLFAWEDVEDRAWLNSEFIGKYQEMGTAVTIVPNARGTIQLPLISEKR